MTKIIFYLLLLVAYWHVAEAAKLLSEISNLSVKNN